MPKTTRDSKNTAQDKSNKLTSTNFSRFKWWYVFPPLLVIWCLSKAFQWLLGESLMAVIHPGGASGNYGLAYFNRDAKSGCAYFDNVFEQYRKNGGTAGGWATLRRLGLEITPGGLYCSVHEPCGLSGYKKGQYILYEHLAQGRGNLFDSRMTLISNGVWSEDLDACIALGYHSSGIPSVREPLSANHVPSVRPETSMRREMIDYPGGCVETLISEASSATSPTQAGKRYLICFPGNMTRFEEDFNIQTSFIPNVLHSYDQIILVNPPDVGYSACYDRRRRTMDDLFDSAQVAVDNLLKQDGVDPSRVTIYGHSLGGTVAARVAHRCHQNGSKVNLVADRTLSTVPDFIMGLVLSTNKILWPVLVPIALVVCIIAAVVLRLSGCHISCSWDYFAIPKANRVAYEMPTDQVIRPQARLSWSLWGMLRRVHDHTIQSYSSIGDRSFLLDSTNPKKPHNEWLAANKNLLKYSQGGHTTRAQLGEAPSNFNGFRIDNQAWGSADGSRSPRA